MRGNMVKISIGKSLNINLGGKKKEEPKPAEPQKPVERRCCVCGTNTTTTGDKCPKCQSRL